MVIFWVEKTGEPIKKLVVWHRIWYHELLHSPLHSRSSKQGVYFLNFPSILAVIRLLPAHRNLRLSDDHGPSVPTESEQEQSPYHHMLA